LIHHQFQTLGKITLIVSVMRSVCNSSKAMIVKEIFESKRAMGAKTIKSLASRFVI